MARRKTTTMKDVADLAGVSQTTVSFVLNDKPGMAIAEETRDRIFAAVEELNYRPNAAAQTLRTSKTHLIGLISDEIATTPFAGQIIEGAQDAAWENGKLLLLLNTGGKEDVKEAAAATMLDRQVEGIIYATMYHRVANPPAPLRNLPVILLDCFLEDRSLPSVVPDEVQGGRVAVEYLLNKGHQQIGFINNVDPIPATAGRLEGYRQSLASHGIGYRAELVVAEDSNARGGYRGVQRLMELPYPPTAIFCFNDRTAMGAYDALRKLGLDVPGDVAVIGFDNEDIIAAHLYPPLTTVQLPHYAMGEWAMNYLLGQVDAAGPEPIQHKLDCPLVVRSSA